MTQQEKGKYSKIIDSWIKGIDLFSSFLMVLLTIVVFGEVLSRYVFNFPLVFSTELTQLLFPWIIFITAISVTKNEDHLSINFFRELMPKFAQKIAFLIAKLVMLYFSFFMFISSYEIAQAVNSQILPVLRIPKSWLYYSVTVSFVGVIIVLLIQIMLILMNKLEPPREEDMLNDYSNDR
ncbi:TRAP transporter small permease [Aquibacillus albus]|uniref:TRAP-type C4-dicarboxylate transport system permease small subunit n=1 Tax=Aquibacillus albus TaxID=1168171 RepID=A0ABS2MWT7_9BACI|nr:TRAP transporter small permease [Aquibacillus albus]MBM7570349.1 TRAP-type C4-dicarboxylate transport system permease small subunit [Aquibacillus albus]